MRQLVALASKLAVWLAKCDLTTAVSTLPALRAT